MTAPSKHLPVPSSGQLAFFKLPIHFRGDARADGERLEGAEGEGPPLWDRAATSLRKLVRLPAAEKPQPSHSASSGPRVGDRFRQSATSAAPQVWPSSRAAATMPLAAPLRVGGALAIKALRLGDWKKPKPAPHSAIAPATAGEKISRIRSVNLIVSRGGKGDVANGRLLFQKNCATCHTLFGEGNKIGPDLTSADRKNREYLITQIVDPSAVIRAEYQAFTVETKDGRSLFGLIVESTPGAVTLVDSKNERTVLARSKIEEMTSSATSLMPEKILDPLSDEELCDLFSYLQGEEQSASKGGKPPR